MQLLLGTMSVNGEQAWKLVIQKLFRRGRRKVYQSAIGKCTTCEA
jgi:hypothetical protein